MDVETYVKAVAAAGDRYHAKLVELGEGFKGRLSAKDAGLARWVKREKPRARMCYMNAQKYVVLHDDELTYYEGYWHWSVGMVPTHHAWLVDGEGHVIDLTGEDCDRQFPDANPAFDEYFGLPVPTWFVRQQVMETKEWGVISAKWMAHLGEAKDAA